MGENSRSTDQASQSEETVSLRGGPGQSPSLGLHPSAWEDSSFSHPSVFPRSSPSPKASPSPSSLLFLFLVKLPFQKNIPPLKTHFCKGCPQTGNPLFGNQLKMLTPALEWLLEANSIRSSGFRAGSASYFVITMKVQDMGH